MHIRLHPAAGNLRIIREMLESRGITISDEAEILLAPFGTETTDTGVLIRYDPEDLDGMLAFFDSCISIPSLPGEKTILVRDEDVYSLIPADEVIFFQAAGNSVLCRTSGIFQETAGKLYQLEQDFRDRGFIRISKSCIVNVRKIDQIVPWFGGRLLLRFHGLSEKAEVSRSYVRTFKNLLGMN